jgi:hypothetical protein
VKDLFSNFDISFANSIKGALGVLEFRDLPFEAKRIYWISEVPTGAIRGQHAHKSLRQLLVLLSGGFKIILDNGQERQEVKLIEPGGAILLHPGLWREILDFDEGTVALIVCDQEYDESDYIREYSEFIAWKNDK